MNKIKLQSVPLKNVTIQDNFWSKYTRLVQETIIPYQWDILNDRVQGAEPSHCLENLRIAAGDAQGNFHGAVFRDTDVAKWLEAVAFSLEVHPDAELEKTADEVIELIGRAQCKDGYINTYYTLVEPGHRWTNLMEGHELYTAGHFIEAAVAYYNATGKRRFLDIVMRFADLICTVFGEGEEQIHGYPGHPEIELALVKLYHATGERRYLDLAKYFIDRRGTGKNYFLQEQERPDFCHIFDEFKDYDPRYSQSHMPVRQQTTAEGHAVRAVYLYCAMADLAYEYQDEKLLAACERIWDNITRKRMYIIGGIGSSGMLERFTADYDLPNDCNYAETCAAIGLALFSLRMAQITREAKYMDVVELALYNNILSGIALDGKSFFYVNPLEVWPANCLSHTSRGHVKPVRQKWFGCACCPPNVARTLASLGQYIYAADADSLYVNLFIANKTTVNLEAGKLEVELETSFPKENQFVIRINGGSNPVTLCLRIPVYARQYSVAVDGKPVQYEVRDGYAVLHQVFNQSKVCVSFEAPAVFVRANPRVHADAGKVAVMRGPLVYCMEETDNGDELTSIAIKSDAKIEEKWEENLLGGVTSIYIPAYRQQHEGWEDGSLYKSSPETFEPTAVKMIPYCYWNNRAPGEMLVWIRELIQ